MKAYEVAQQLGVSSHFVSRITGMMFISKGKENINIGLDLKNNKKNEEVHILVIELLVDVCPNSILLISLLLTNVIIIISIYILREVKTDINC